MFFKNLETERLWLINISENDSAFILAQFSDDAVTRYLFDAEPLTSTEGADAIIRLYTQPEPRDQHRWILVRKSDGIKIGTCGFHFWDRDRGTVETGYDLREAYWGQGYMGEAMDRILAFAFDSMQVNKVNACIYGENARSLALARRLGFVFEGKIKIFRFRERDYPHRVYTLTG